MTFAIGQKQTIFANLRNLKWKWEMCNLLIKRAETLILFMLFSNVGKVGAH